MHACAFISLPKVVNLRGGRIREKYRHIFSDFLGISAYRKKVAHTQPKKNAPIMLALIGKNHGHQELRCGCPRLSSGIVVQQACEVPAFV